MSLGSVLHRRDRAGRAERRVGQYREDCEDTQVDDSGVVPRRVAGSLRYCGREACWQFGFGCQQCRLFDLLEPFSRQHFVDCPALALPAVPWTEDVDHEAPIRYGLQMFHGATPNLGFAALALNELLHFVKG